MNLSAEWFILGERNKNSGFEKGARTFWSAYKREALLLQVGDTLSFGYCLPSFEDLFLLSQIAVEFKSPIAWQIIKKEENKFLLLSKACLYSDQYSDSNEIWADSEIRRNLNQVLFEEWFTDAQKQVIQLTDIPTSGNPIFAPGEPEVTKDKLFLLSYEEIVAYFTGGPNEIAIDRDDGRDYAIGAIANDSLQSYEEYPYYGWDKYRKISEMSSVGILPRKWWLRNQGRNADRAMVIDEAGQIDFSGCEKYNDSIGIRPAMWLNLDQIDRLI